MKNLSNEILVQAYEEAILLKLDKDFILLVEYELLRRGLKGVVKHSGRIEYTLLINQSLPLNSNPTDTIIPSKG